MNSIEIVSLEGNIGSGKSTFLKRLETHFLDAGYSHVIFVDEPVDEWSDITDKKGETILQKFYSKPVTYSFPFQMMAFITRYRGLRLAVQKAQAIIDSTTSMKHFRFVKPIIVTERCLYTDKYVFAQMLYDDNKIEDINFTIYNKWFEEFASEFPIQKIIYMDTNPELCNKRICKRSRSGESNVPLAYLESCNNYHSIMLQKMITSGVKFHKLDGNQNMEDDTMYDTMLNSALTFIMN